MATINLPFAASATKRAPNMDELVNGFPCGDADKQLFDWLAWWESGQIASVISAAGLTVDDTDLQRLLQAIQLLSRGTTAVYSTPGTFSWVCPAGVFRVRAMVWAGGGGGGGAAGSANSVASAGGGGEYREGVFPVTPGTSYTIVVGAGGSFGISTPTNGGAGGSSSFGGVITAIGGGGGLAASGAIQATPGNGGNSGSGGIIARSGLGGGIAYPIGSSFVLAQGGSAFTSNYTYTITTGGIANGAPGVFPGGGASGGAIGGSGGAGAGGQVILEY